MEGEHELVEEPIEPLGGFDTVAMARGEPGLPRLFRWRGAEHRVAAVLRRWKTTGPCWSGSDERYVRRHWYLVRTTDGAKMELYFERQARSARERKRRWWLHSVQPAEGPAG